MKKILLFAFVALISLNSYSQKKKATSKKATPTAGLAKADNLVAEVKAGNFQLTINENGKPKDAMIIKPADAKFAPTNCKLTPFTASGVKLYLLSWTENTLTKTDLKSEDITTVYSVIYDISNKKQVFSNTQMTNHITEKVYLNHTAASETQEKIRREGFELTLNPDGSVKQKGKTQEINLVYDAAKMEYVNKKK